MKRFLPIIIAALIGALVAAPVAAVTTTLNITGFIAAGAGSAATCVLLGTATHTTCNNVDGSTQIQFANKDGASYSTYIGSSSVSSASGVGCNDLRVGQWNGTVNAEDFCIDNNGSGGFRGSVSDNGGTLLPCKFSTSAGAACAVGVKSGYFIATGASCPSSSECPSFLSLSGLPFTSSATWGCTITEIGGGGNFNVVFKINPTSGSAGTIDEFNNSGSTYTAKVFGTCKGT